MEPGRDREADGAHEDVVGLLTSGLGEPLPEAPIEAVWAELRPRLPGAPRARRLRHPAVPIALAAAAALLVLAVVLALASGGEEIERLRLRVLDVPQEERPLTREEAAEIFYGTEAPVLLGSDAAAGVSTGGS